MILGMVHIQRIEIRIDSIFSLTLTNLGPKLQKFVPNKIKILVLLQFNRIHDSYVQCINIFGQKLVFRTKELSQLTTVISSCSDSPRKECSSAFFSCCRRHLCTACCRQDGFVFITACSFTIIKQIFYNCNEQKYFKSFLILIYIPGLVLSNCKLAFIK